MLALALAVVSLVRMAWCSLPERGQDSTDSIEETSTTQGLEGNIMEPEALDVAVAPTSTDESLRAPYGTQILRISDEGTQVYWKKIEGAAGYEVARSYTADGKPEHLAYVTKASFTYTDNSFNHDVGTVYYLVRGLSGDESGYAVGPWSEPIEAHFLTQMQLSRTAWFLPRGDSYQFEASYGWGNVADAQWTSSDKAVAAIDAQGLLTARSAGTTTISCTSAALGQSVEASVEVDRPEQPMLEEPSSRYVQATDGSWYNPEAAESRNAVLVMAGDLMCMGSQMATHYTEDEGYNFNECYQYVKGIFEAADLSVGNLETLLASSYPYNGESGYVNGKPVCNAPARYLDALRFGGLDLLCLANNHNADFGVRGVAMTLEQLDRYQFAHTGLFASADQERTLLVNVNGIKVGFVAYVDATCGFNGQDRSWTDEQRDVLLNYYDPDRVAADIAHLRERGAEYLIGYLHWGVKNHFDPVEGQEQTAQELADAGIDYIVGSHPHLVQRYELLSAADGRKVPCVYSMGDFNSSINQVAGNFDSLLLRIRLHRTQDGRVILAENAYIPCHIYRNYGDEHYVTMPMDTALNGGADLPLYDTVVERIATQVADQLTRYEP